MIARTGCRVLCVLLLVGATRLSAQDVASYFADTSLQMLELDDHLEAPFKWTIKGRSQVLMNEGINDYREGNPQRAILNLDTLIRYDSSFWPAFYYRGLAEKRLRKFPEAEKDFKKVFALNQNGFESYVELGEIYQFRKDFNRAKKYFETGSEVAPSRVEPIYSLARVSVQRGEQVRARKLLNDCLELQPNFAPALVLRGILQYREKNKDCTECLTYFERAIKADTTFLPAYYWHGMLLLAKDHASELPHTEGSLKDWNHLVVLMPDNTTVREIRGSVLAEMGRFDEAFTDFKKVITSAELDESGYLTGKGKLNRQIDLQRGAGYLIQKGYGMNDRVFGLLKKAYCLMALGNYKLALVELKEASRLEPSGPSYHLTAIAFEETKNYDSAVLYYNLALALDNDIYDAHRKIAVYEFEDKDIKGVYAQLKEMKRLEPESPQTYRLSGMIKSELKDYYGCIIDLTKFIRKDSSDFQVWRTRGSCKCEVKDYPGSNADYRQAIKIDGPHKKIYGLIYRNNLLQGDTLAGLKTLRQIDAQWPNDHELKLSMAEIMLRLKKCDSAALVIFKLLKEIGTEFPPSPYKTNALFLQGQALICQKYFEKGMDKIDESSALDPRNSYKIFYRARMRLHLGQTKDAIKDLKKLQDIGYAPAKDYISKYLGN